MKIYRVILIILLALVMTGCQNKSIQEPNALNFTEVGMSEMKIEVLCENKRVVFQLNTSSASKSLYDQLPLEIAVSDYAHNEKIFYPPNSLDLSDTPMATGDQGTIAYFSPWGDVVMYFGSFDAYTGLYELGHVIEGEEWISELTGIISINIVES
ncbi:MAG: cyclophilin-like fold protein [Beduini sp.]|uniref:cyclophilin-like fold protein n=1 Tax=Beduini sp. TaxID=1922300 RepID=UPI0011C9ED4E